MKNAAEIIGYIITITKEDFDAAKKADVTEQSFWLGWVLAKATPEWIVNKDTEII